MHPVLLAGLSIAIAYSVASYLHSVSTAYSFTWISFVIYAVLLLLKITYSVILYPIFFTPYKHLPTPPGRSTWNGHFKALGSLPHIPVQRWVRDIPNDGLIRYYMMFNMERLIVSNRKALADVLIHRPYDWQKTKGQFATISKLTGTGLLLAEGDVHKAQRRKLNPALSYRNVKDSYPIFWQKGVEMVQAISETVKLLPADKKVVTIGDWASRATLDIIGLAVVGYDFDSIRDPNNSLHHAYKQLSKPASPLIQIIWLSSLVSWPALFYYLPLWYVRSVNEASDNIRKFSRHIIEENKQRMAKDDKSGIGIVASALENGSFTNEELVEQVMTFLAAGHETTSGSIQYAVHALCKHPHIQKRLRDEVNAKLPAIISCGDPRNNTNDQTPPSASLLDSMPYLNAFCNEVLRFYPPVPQSARAATRDTFILNTFIKKGTTINIAPRAFNHSIELWGLDAEVFNPDRWMRPGQGNTGGADNNYAFLTFMHGPRNCIGSGFAKGEMLCLVAALVKSFKMELENPDKEMEFKNGVTCSPKDGVRARLTSLN